MIAAEEMERLRVRLADLPGFDPVGLVVQYEGDERLLCVGQFDGGVLLDDEGPDGEQLAALPEQCEVSTADARTRDALARWVAGRIGRSVGSIAPGWVMHRQRWELSTDGDDTNTYFGVDWERPDVVVPTLGDLDPRDPRLLPDGSRWVDAAALAAVARHVGGQP